MKFLRTVTSFIFFCLVWNQVSGQPQVKDSLLAILNTGPTGQARVDVLNQLAYQYYDNNDTLAFAYANEALTEAERVQYLEGIKYAYTLIGLGYSSQSAYARAIENYKKSDAVVAASNLAVYNLVLWGNVYRDLAKYDSAFMLYKTARMQASPTDGNLSIIHKNIALIYANLWQNDLAINYLDSATAQLKIFPNPFVQLDVWSMYGKAYRNLLQYGKSQEYFNKMCESAFQIEDYYSEIKCRMNQTDLALATAEFSQALKSCFEALELTEKYNYPPQYVQLLIQTGEVYVQLSQHDVAARYLYQGLKQAQKLGFDFEAAQCLSELAWIKKERREYGVALDLIEQSQQIREKIGDINGLANCRSVRGLVYFLMKEYDLSLQEFDAALKFWTQVNNREGMSAAIFNSALVYEGIGEFDKALELQKRSIAMDEKTENRLNQAISYNSISTLLIKMDRLNDAMVYMKRATQLAETTNSKGLKRSNAENYVKYYEATRAWREAYLYQRKLQALNDSIYSEASMVKLAEMEALYNLDKKEDQIAFLNQQQRVKEEQIKLQQSQLTQKNIIIFSVVVVLLVAGMAGYVGYQSYRTKHVANLELTKLNKNILEQKEEIQAQSEELIEANQAIAESNRSLEDRVEARTRELKQAYKELDTFFYRSSHDFRRPLTTFLGLAEVAKITVKDENAIELFAKVQDTAHNLDRMLLKLQSISDLGTQQLVYKEVFVKEMLAGVLSSFHEPISRHNIQTHVEVDLKSSFYSYPAMVKIIVENLVENSIHFCGVVDPYIRIGVQQQDGMLQLTLEDNGQGIHSDYQDRIFEMYFRANQNSKGNGLGLYIARKAVEKLRGSIDFKSQHGLGSTFIVVLPLEQKT